MEKLYKTGINMYAPGTYKEDCVFCQKYLDAEFDVIDDCSGWIMVKDKYPVSPGHLLLITTQHYEDYFETYIEVQKGLRHMLQLAYNYIDKEYPKSTGINIGFNCGKDAGQTVMHTHVHVIPRYESDCLDPTGGVRNVIPGKGNYKLI